MIDKEELELKFGQRGRYFLRKVLSGSKLFVDKKGTFIAASCSFYTLLNFFPLALFLISLISWIFEDRSFSNKYFLEFVFNFLPELDKGIKSQITNILAGGSIKLGVNPLNILFFIFSSLGLFRAILIGLSFISGNQVKSNKLYLNSVFGILVVIGVFFSQAVILPIFLSVKGVFFKYDLLTEDINSGIGIFDSVINLLRYFFTHYWVSVFNISFTFLTMGLVFYIIFGKVSKLRDCLIGSTVFLVLTLFGKSLFWQYISQVRSRLLISYGDFFSIVVIFLWIFYLYNCFFYASCIVRSKVEYKD